MFASLLILQSCFFTQTDVDFKRINNSAGISQVMDIDRRGNVFGYKDVIKKSVIHQIAFVIIDEKESQLIVPKGYTAIQSFRLSDNLRLAGFASRSPNPKGNSQACVWNLKSGEVELLPKPQPNQTTYAFDISSDGLTVVGFATTRGQHEMQPCVWSKRRTGWTVKTLLTPNKLNPLLLGAKVVISDNGKYLSACLAMNDEKNLYAIRSGVFLWTRKENGDWTRKKLLDEPIYQANINDSGVIGGYVIRNRKRRGCIFDEQHGLRIFQPLKGDVKCQVTDVNNCGTVVGISDSPTGPDGGSRGIVIRDSKATQAAMPGRYAI